MRIVVAAVGRLKDGAQRELLDHYLERARVAGRGQALLGFEVSELAESRATNAAQRCREEAEALLAATRGISHRVVLHEHGRAMTSREFAVRLGRERDAGCAAVGFLIGGPDGHGEAALAAATLQLSLGAMTLPHGLARIVLAEQLYRAVTILAGHPYHRD